MRRKAIAVAVLAYLAHGHSLWAQAKAEAEAMKSSELEASLQEARERVKQSREHEATQGGR